MPIDHNKIFDRVAEVARCQHDFGTHRTEAVGTDGKTRVVKGRCSKCGCSFPTSWTEVQNLSPYALYLIAMAVSMAIEPVIKAAVIDAMNGSLLDDIEPEGPKPPQAWPPQRPGSPPAPPASSTA